MPTKHRGIIITKTPFRISFLGGGTDFSDYFNEHGGAVLGAAINKYMYVTVNSLERFCEKRIRLSYSKLELVDEPKELEHEIVKHILLEHPYWSDKDFLDIHSYADLPASSGVGSSSAFTVGMLNALYSLCGIYKPSKLIAKEAITIEREKVKDKGGWQDQIFSAYGGFCYISFKNNNFTVTPVVISKEKRRALEEACLIFFTGELRSSANIQNKVGNTNNNAKNKFLPQLKKMADEAHNVLSSCNPKDIVYEFGKLLHDGWVLKQSLSSHISNSTIDEMYENGIKAGAIGGKLCGAGGGGFVLFVVPPDKKEAVTSALSKHKGLDVTFEDQGSRVIYSHLCD